MSSIWKEKWTEDLEFLRENLVKRHVNLFFSLSKEKFDKLIDSLIDKIDNLEYDDMKVEISRVVASIGDAHTSVAFPINKYLPIKFYIFNDGVYITKAIKGYEKLLYKKLEEVEGINIKEVLSEISNIISHENEYFLKAQAVKYLQAVDILYGLYICDNKDKVNIKVNGELVTLTTVSQGELNYKEVDGLPLYARKSSENYWFEQGLDELYIKYNSCREDNIRTLKDKLEETISLIKKEKIDKVTIDLRNNLGGDSTLLEPLLNYVKSNSDINKKGNLKVIIGRETFSSALLNAYQFKFDTNAIILGEPSGGKPNCYGEILRFILPNSKFSVSYSTRYYKLIEDDHTLALYPDEVVEEYIEDYILK